MPLQQPSRARTKVAAELVAPDGDTVTAAQLSATGLVLVIWTLWVHAVPAEVQIVAGITGATPVPAITPDITGPATIPNGEPLGMRGTWLYQAAGLIDLEVTVSGADATVEGTITAIPVART